MPELILHVGPDKTGTTAIQLFCAAHSRLLARSKKAYPVLSSMIHHGLLTAAFMDNPLVLPFTRKMSIKEVTSRISRQIQEIERVASSGAIESIILSHEGVHALSDAELRKYREFLDSVSDRVTVLYYVREPFEYARSAISQRICMGRDPFFPDVPALNHRAILTRYKECFGKKRLVVRPYKSDIISDFLSQIGIKHRKAAAYAGQTFRRNESLRGFGVEVGRRVIKKISELK